MLTFGVAGKNIFWGRLFGLFGWCFLGVAPVLVFDALVPCFVDALHGAFDGVDVSFLAGGAVFLPVFGDECDGVFEYVVLGVGEDEGEGFVAVAHNFNQDSYRFDLSGKGVSSFAFFDDDGVRLDNRQNFSYRSKF